MYALPPKQHTHATCKVLIYSQPEPDGIGDLVMAAFLARQAHQAQCHVGIYIDYSLYAAQAQSMKQFFAPLVADLPCTLLDNLATAQAWGAQRVIIGPGSNEQAMSWAADAHKVLLVGEYGQPMHYRPYLLQLEAAHVGMVLDCAIKEVAAGFTAQTGIIKLTPAQIAAIPATQSWEHLDKLPTAVATAIRQGRYFLGYAAQKAHKRSLIQSIYVHVATQLLQAPAACVVILPGHCTAQDQKEIAMLLDTVAITPSFYHTGLDGAISQAAIRGLAPHPRRVHLLTGHLCHQAFLCLMKGTQYPVLTTGDQSTGEAISLGKVPIYDLHYVHKVIAGQQLSGLHRHMPALVLRRDTIPLEYPYLHLQSPESQEQYKQRIAACIRSYGHRIVPVLNDPNTVQVLSQALETVPCLSHKLRPALAWLAEKDGY